MSSGWWAAFGAFKASSNFLPWDSAVQVLSEIRPWHHLSPLLRAPWVGRGGWAATGQQRPRDIGCPDQRQHLSVWPRVNTYRCRFLQKEAFGSDNPKKKKKSMTLVIAQTVVAGSLRSIQKEMGLSFRRKNLI